MLSSAGISGPDTGPCWLQTSHAFHTTSLEASSYWATTIPSNCTTQWSSFAMAAKRSFGSRCAPIACETRINASYRSEGRYSDGAADSEPMRVLGVAIITPLSNGCPDGLRRCTYPTTAELSSVFGGRQGRCGPPARQRGRRQRGDAV